MKNISITSTEQGNIAWNLLKGSQLKPCLSKLGKWLKIRCLIAFWRQTDVKKQCQNSDNDIDKSNLKYPDVTSGIVIWHHAWRQKPDRLCSYNHLHNFGKQGFSYGLLTKRFSSASKYSVLTTTASFSINNLSVSIESSWEVE